MPPMTLNVERLYQLLVDFKAQIERGDFDGVPVRDVTHLLVESLLAAIDHPYPTPPDAG